MNRRGFLGALAALAATPALVAASEPSVIRHDPVLDPQDGSTWWHQEIRAPHDVAVGDFVYSGDQIVGIAMNPIHKNEYGVVVISGPARCRGGST